MTFKDLATYFEKLEETSSRLALIDILADLFAKTSKEEIDEVIYLLQGRIAPFYAPIEIGMADKMVASALALAFGEDKEHILKLYSQKGDMGLVAQELKSKSKNQKSNISVKEVFDALTEIAETSGEGTVEKRVSSLSELLQQVDALSAKHLVRIPLGNTRLGIGDPTVLDGLALAVLGDRSKRKLLEKAYNETSDLGLIGKTLKMHGLAAVEKLKITVGRPIRSELCERLPNPEKVFEKMASAEVSKETPSSAKATAGKKETDERKGAAFAKGFGPASQSISEASEPKGVHTTYKYDGFRVQIHKDGDTVRMYSRNLEEMTHMFPELIEGTLKQVKAKTAILDTEALAYQPESEEFLPFQETTKRRRKYKIDEMQKALPLKAFVFDILYVDGTSLIDTPLLKRMEVLKKVIHGSDILIPSPGEVVMSPEKMQVMLDEAISKGLEGLVVKRVDSLYEAGGRNFNWVKLKRHSSGELQDTIDCVILGYIYGKGKRTAFGAGALLVGVYDSEKDTFESVTRIGTGLSDEEWRSIKEKAKGLEVDHKPARVNSMITPSVWLKPQIVIEVLADEITKSPLHTAGMGSIANRKSQIAKSREKDNAESSNAKAEKPLGLALRFPRLITFRDKDKRPEDATTVKELLAMYRSQGKK